MDVSENKIFAFVLFITRNFQKKCPKYPFPMKFLVQLVYKMLCIYKNIIVVVVYNTPFV